MSDIYNEWTIGNKPHTEPPTDAYRKGYDNIDWSDHKPDVPIPIKKARLRTTKRMPHVSQTLLDREKQRVI